MNVSIPSSQRKKSMPNNQSDDSFCSDSSSVTSKMRSSSRKMSTSLKKVPTQVTQSEKAIYDQQDSKSKAQN